MKQPDKTPQMEGLLRAARALPEDDRTPFAFEKRVMHAIRSSRPVDVWSVWTQSLWRAALACVAISFLAGAVANFEEEAPSPPELLAADLEQAVLASITPDETW